MLRRSFLGSLACSAIAGAQTTQRPPNLVFFLTDDLGYADIGCYGARDIRTPHIDRLAKEGVRFTDCYANAPVCTPTRVGFLTGRYQQRFGADLEWAMGPATNKTGGLMPSQSVLPGALKKVGYRTAIHGKWHVGWKPECRPEKHGFDDWFGILLGNADMYTHRYHDGSKDLWDNGKPAEREGYLTELLAERSAQFVEKHAKEPFFLYVPFNAPHWPFQPPGDPRPAAPLPAWRDGTRANYARMVESVDTAIGRVMDAIRRTGNDNNTLVVFTNDNGGERLSDSSPLFHGKATLFEGGIRVPAIARWPGVVPEGTTTSQTAMTMDFTATFLQAAGAQPRDGIRLDGMDLLPVLTRRAPEKERSLFWRIDRPGRRQLAVRRGRWKYLDDNSGNREMPELLFDLQSDVSERKNRFRDNQQLALELRKEALAWQQAL